MDDAATFQAIRARCAVSRHEIDAWQGASGQFGVIAERCTVEQPDGPVQVFAIDGDEFNSALEAAVAEAEAFCSGQSAP